MSRPKYIFARGVNQFWSSLQHLNLDAPVPSETHLCKALNTSRGTVRAILRYSTEAGVIAASTRGRVLQRHPNPADYFKVSHTVSPTTVVEREFLRRIQNGSLQPSQRFSELQLARETATSTPVVREFLIGFARSGLVEKLPKGGWILRAFDRRFAEELAQIRHLLEFAAFDRMAISQLRDEDQDEVTSLIERHEAIAAFLDERHGLFPELDRDFHSWLLGHLDNRFANDFFNSISAIFHFHYLVRRSLEKALNDVAIRQHLAILKPLGRGDFATARTALEEHLRTSLSSLLSSLSATAVVPSTPVRLRERAASASAAEAETKDRLRQRTDANTLRPFDRNVQ